MDNTVAVAHEHAKIAQKVYNDYVNLVMNTKDDLNWAELDNLARRANYADRKLLEARHAALNPCTCTPLSDACPVCVADNKDRYGESIPFGGE